MCPVLTARGTKISPRLHKGAEPLKTRVQVSNDGKKWSSDDVFFYFYDGDCQVYDEKKSVTVGTICSGSDLIVRVLWALSSLLNSHSLKVEFDHCWSCETISWKQQFIQDNYKPEFMFSGAVELESQEAVDVMFNALVTVPPTDILLCGFSCIVVSQHNIYTHV